MKKVWIAITVCSLVSLVGVIILVALASRDIAAPDTTDLVPDRPESLVKENAFTYFNSAIQALHWPTEDAYLLDYLDGQIVDGRQIHELIIQNAQTLEHVDRGLTCEICLAPEVNSIETLMPHLGDWRNIARVMALKIRHNGLAGHYAEATDTCVSPLRFASLIQEKAEGSVGCLVGISVLELGLRQARKLARDDDMPSKSLARLADALAEINLLYPGLVHAIKVEYKIAANAIDGLRDGTFSLEESLGVHFGSPKMGLWMPGYFFQPNKTKLMFADLYRDIIKNARRHRVDMELDRIVEWSGLKDKKVRLVAYPNAVGHLLGAVLVPAMAGYWV